MTTKSLPLDSNSVGTLGSRPHFNPFPSHPSSHLPHSERTSDNPESCWTSIFQKVFFPHTFQCIISGKGPKPGFQPCIWLQSATGALDTWVSSHLQKDWTVQGIISSLCRISAFFPQARYIRLKTNHLEIFLPHNVPPA